MNWSLESFPLAVNMPEQFWPHRIVRVFSVLRSLCVCVLTNTSLTILECASAQGSIHLLHIYVHVYCIQYIFTFLAFNGIALFSSWPFSCSAHVLQNPLSFSDFSFRCHGMRREPVNGAMSLRKWNMLDYNKIMSLVLAMPKHFTKYPFCHVVRLRFPIAFWMFVCVYVW